MTSPQHDSERLPASVRSFLSTGAFLYGDGGVEALRDFIVDLAITGRLATGVASEPSARGLIEMSRAALRGQRARTLDELDASPFDLPSNWVWCQPQQVGIVSPRNEIDGSASVGFVPMDLVPTDYRRSVRFESRQWGDVRKGYTHFAEGDVGVAKITPCFQNRKSCVFEGLPSGFGAGTTELIVLRPVRGCALPKYLLLYFKSQFFISAGVQRMTGTAGQQRIPVDYLAAAPLPLPPLGEQARIVEVVDRLMAMCDELESLRIALGPVRDRLSRAVLGAVSEHGTDLERDAALVRLRRAIGSALDGNSGVEAARQTVLDLAVQGRLSKQQESDTPASITLARIARARGTDEGRWGTEGPFDLPPGWCWARLGDLGEFGRGKSKHRPRNDPKLFEGGKYPLVQTGDVARANGTVTTYTGLYGEFGLAQSKLWPIGTLCITIAANIADSAVLGFEACFPDSVVGLVAAPEFGGARFFDYFVRTAQRRLEEYAPSTAQKNINLEVLSNLWVPVPPVEEMQRIVEVTERLLGMCDALQGLLLARERCAEHFAKAVSVSLVEEVDP